MALDWKPDSVRGEPAPTLTDVRTEVLETQLALVEVYEAQDDLQTQITELQLAMVEQYETLEGGNE